ncbi:MAG TPA: two-component regulator propeller domain-containing protein [Acidisarcina sp.]
MQDGSFRGAPTAITQTADGYIWIGTNIGLVRFDGVSFVPWSSPAGTQLLDLRVFSLLGTEDGSLWIGTGFSVSRWKDGVLVNYPQLSGRIESLLEAKDGGVWLVRTQITDNKGPLCHIKGSDLQCYGGSDAFPFPFAMQLARSDSADLWIAGYSQLCRWRPGSGQVYFKNLAHHSTDFASLRAIASGRHDEVWAALEQPKVPLQLQRIVHGMTAAVDFPEIKVSNSDVQGLFVDKSNALWIATSSHGIYRSKDQRTEHFGSAEGLSSDATSGFFEDREGDVWVVTSAGIDNFRDLQVASYSIQEGLSAAGASSVLASRDGTLWVGNAKALDMLRDDKFSAIRTGRGLPGDVVTTMFEDHQDRLWVGLDTGLWVYERGRFKAVRHADGSSLGNVFAITEEGQDIWVRAGLKLDRIRDLKLEEELTSPEIKEAFTLAADPSGGLVLGLVDGALMHYRDGEVTSVRADAVGNSQQIRDLLVNADGSVWGTTLDELSYWKDGRRRNLTTRNGLPCGGIFALLKDDRQSIWLYAQCGLIEIERSELSRWLRQPDSVVQVRVLDEFDGARPGLTSLKPQTARTADGRLWFVNGRILQMLDNKRALTNSLPPQLHIENIVVDRHSYAATGDLRLPPLTHDLEVDYTATSFVAPQKVLFKYRLEGHDAEWQEPGTRRQAFYSDLRPGRYKFRVIACNNSGVWSGEGAVFAFTVDAAYYQTAWFKILLALAVLGLLWVLYLLRLQQLTEQMQARLGERLVERERIARELHDTLLQGFQGLMLRFQAVMKSLPQHGEAHRAMEQVLDRADKVLLEGRQRVRDLRAEGMTGDDLPDALANCGKELVEHYATEFSLSVLGMPQRLDPTVCNEIYRIGREALTNAFQHAKASKIEAELTFLGSGPRLVVRDNGQGIDPGILNGGRAGHWGLSGMRERAERVGGTLSIWSHTGAGTELEIKIPGRIAYSHARVAASRRERARRAARNFIGKGDGGG